LRAKPVGFFVVLENNMHIRPIILIGLVFAAAAIGTNGCYTMLEHPRVSLVDESTGNEEQVTVDHAERCTDCHTGEMHGTMPYGSSGSPRSSHASDDWYDYDPFQRDNSYGYYDPFFYSTPLYSPYFYDNYYNYRNNPWWVSYQGNGGGYSSGGSGGDSGKGSGSGTGTSVKEKPVRRGGDDPRGFSPLPSSPRPSQNTEKPSTTTPSPSGSSSSGNDDSSKEKPVRRGGVK